MRAFFTVFDRDNLQIGFAKAKRDEPKKTVQKLQQKKHQGDVGQHGVGASATHMQYLTEGAQKVDAGDHVVGGATSTSFYPKPKIFRPATLLTDVESSTKKPARSFLSTRRATAKSEVAGAAGSGSTSSFFPSAFFAPGTSSRDSSDVGGETPYGAPVGESFLMDRAVMQRSALSSDDWLVSEHQAQLWGLAKKTETKPFSTYIA